MRTLMMSLVLVSVSCAQAPRPVMKQPAVQTATASTQTKQEGTAAQPAAQDHIQASDVAKVLPATPAAPVVMDMGSMQGQVQSAFAQTNLNADQKAAMSDKTMALIAAANAGDQAAVTKLSNELVKQAMAGKGVIPGFGLVDVAGVVDAIMDLIAAAADADVAGIVDALKDLVAALVA